jgi:hypothetical protein
MVETLVSTYESTRRQNIEEEHLLPRRRENLSSHTGLRLIRTSMCIAEQLVRHQALSQANRVNA